MKRRPAVAQGAARIVQASLLLFAGFSVLESADYLRANPDLFSLLYHPVLSALAYLAIGLVASAVFSVILFLMPGRAPRSFPAVRLCCLLVTFLLVGVVGFRVNDEWLGDFFSPMSLGVNLALFLFLLTILLLVIRMEPRGRVLRWIENSFGLRGAVLTSVVILLALTYLGSRARGERIRPDEGSTGTHSSINVVLITVDTMRSDHMTHTAGRAATPVLDSLATEGVSFRRAVSASASTAPSTASILTSLYPSSHRVQENGQVLGARFVTLPEILKANGYYSIGFVSNYFISSKFGFDQGFDRFDEGALCTGDADWSRAGDEFIEEAVAFLREPEREPFFLWVHFIEPHLPYDVQEEYFRKPAGARSDRVGSVFQIEMANRYNGGDLELEEPDLIWVRAMYASEVARADDLVGRLLSEVSSSDHAGNTLVVVTADHGESLGEREFIGHGVSLVGEQINVPLIVALPGDMPHRWPEGRIVSNMDVMPTIFEIVGVEAPPFLMGRSLILPEEHRPSLPAGLVFSEISKTGQVACFREPFKLMLTPNPSVDPLLRGSVHLFDIDRDSPGRHDLSESHRDIVEDLQARISAWRTRITCPIPRYEQIGSKVDEIVLGRFRKSSGTTDDGETLKALKALGYVN